MIRGTPFQPGNKLGRGRPKGSRNKPTSVVMQMLEEHQKVLTLGTIAEGIKGNVRSRLWCMQALLNKTQVSPKMKLPPIKTLDDLKNACDMVVNAVARGKCAAADGKALIEMLAEMRKIFETQDLNRLDDLEQLVKKT